MTDRILFDLAGAEDDRRFSPYCWRTRMALAHKGLPVDAVPWRFTETEALAASGQRKVPVLVDGETVVADSWAIAVYLEQTYPDRPSLFGGPAAQHVSRFLNAWADSVLIRGIAPLIIADIHACLHEKDKAYFRASREKAFGASLEATSADRDQKIDAFRRTLEPLRTVLRAQKFLSGDAPAYADYIPFGAFQWARCTSAFPMLASDDTVLTGWMDRLLDMHEGLGRKALV